jgi:hypothetical protein
LHRCTCITTRIELLKLLIVFYGIAGIGVTVAMMGMRVHLLMSQRSSGKDDGCQCNQQARHLLLLLIVGASFH